MNIVFNGLRVGTQMVIQCLLTLKFKRQLDNSRIAFLLLEGEQVGEGAKESLKSENELELCFNYLLHKFLIDQFYEGFVSCPIKLIIQGVPKLSSSTS